MRAFTAIELSTDVKVKISRLAEGMPSQNLSFVKESDMHVTLHFFANISEEHGSKVIEAINSLQIEKFETRIKGLSYFGDREIRVVFANVEDSDGRVLQIYQSIGKYLSDFGVEYDRKEKFVPHITIARSRGNDPQLKRFLGENSDHDFGVLTVSQISFKSSMLTDRGVVHTTLFERKV